MASFEPNTSVLVSARVIEHQRPACWDVADCYCASTSRKRCVWPLTCGMLLLKCILGFFFSSFSDGSSPNIFLLANSFIYSLAHSVSLKRWEPEGKFIRSNWEVDWVEMLPSPCRLLQPYWLCCRQLTPSSTLEHLGRANQSAIVWADKLKVTFLDFLKH